MTTLQELLKQWEARSKDTSPTDAMLINKHIRELRAALAQQGEQAKPVAYITVTAHGWGWGLLFVGALVHVVAHVSLIMEALK